MGFTKQTLATLVSLALITACGGGSKDLSGGTTNSTTTTTTTNSPSGSTSTTTTTTPSSATNTSGTAETVTYSISMRIQECTNIQDVSTCQDKNTDISTSKPNRIIAVVTDSKGLPVDQVIVAASTTVGATTAQQMTNAKGEAFFNLSATSDSSNKAGTVTVTSTVKGVAVTTSQNFQFGAGTVTEVVGYKLNMSLKSCSDAQNLNSCSETTSLPIGNGNISLVDATFLDSSNTPVKDAIVSATTTKGSFKPGAERLTDASGKVTYILSADSGNFGQAGTITLNAKTSLGGTDYTASSTKNFQFGENQLALTLASSVSGALPVGSVAVLSTRVTNNGNLYSDPVNVSFTSACTAKNLAKLDASVSTINGIATATYVGQGSAGVCGQTDTIIASIDSSTDSSARAQIDIANTATTPVQIKGDKPSPAAICLAGGNCSSQSQIVFTVTDNTGTAKANVPVDFSFAQITGMETVPSDYSLNPTSGTTNSEGKITVTVKAGSLPIPFRVQALLHNTPDVRITSDQIAVGTGYPDSDSFSPNPEVHSMDDAWNTDGIENKFTVRLGDHFNNPVPDGTVVTFITEGGTIMGDAATSGGKTGSCVTKDNSCMVTLISQAPRPNDGRVTVLAYVEGEESFSEALNGGNGIFDQADLIDVIADQDATGASSNWKAAFKDLNEAYLDKDFNQLYDSSDLLVDVDNNGQHTLVNGKLNSLSCSADLVDRGFCERKLVYPFKNIEVIFSGLEENNGAVPSLGLALCNSNWSNCTLLSNNDTVDVTTNPAYLTFTPKYTINGTDNPIPTGSTLAITQTNGEAAEPVGISFKSTYPDTTRPFAYKVIINPETEPNKKSEGKFSVTATTPNGKFSVTSASIKIKDAG